MKSGLGTAGLRIPNTDVTVAAMVAVNAVGDVYTDGKIIAGARQESGVGFRSTIAAIERGYGVALPAESSTNTTIAIIATNAKLDRLQMTKVSQMAHDGMARAINPVHTLWDGDTVFAAATGTAKTKVNHSSLGAIGAQVLARAIVRAVTQAASLPELPSARDYR